MKKFLTYLLVICMSICFTSCVSNTPVSNEETQQKSAETIFGLNDTATLKDIKITAIALEESKGIQFFEAEDDKIFVGVKFEIENISEETQSISSILLFDAYADDIKCTYSLSANASFGDGTLDGSLAPGKKLVGWYPVEIPQDWQNLELEFKSNWLSNNSAKFVFNK